MATMTAAAAIAGAQVNGSAERELQEVRRLAADQDLPRALARLDAYLSRSPDDHQARFLKGMLLIKAGRSAEATKLFETLGASDPDMAEPQNNLGVLLAADGRLDAAARAFESAIRSQPACRVAFDNLRQVNGELASQAYSQALEIPPLQTSPALRLVLLELGSARGVAPAAGAAAGAAVDVVAQAVATEPLAAPSSEPATPAPPPPAPPSAPPPASEESPPETAGRGAPEPAPAIADRQPSATPAPSTRGLAEPPPPEGAPEAIAETVAAPAQPPPSKPTPPEPRGRAEGDLQAAALRLPNEWAAAWSAQRPSDYLAFYSSAFRPPGGIGRAEWEAQRRERLTRPRSIEVRVSDVAIELWQSDLARVRFVQRYRSDSYRDVVVKTLELAWESGSWRILEETAE